MSVEQVCRSIVDRCNRLAHIAAGYGLPNNLIAHIKAPQNPGIEYGFVSETRLPNLIGLRHGARDRLFQVEHRHAQLRDSNAQLGMIFTFGTHRDQIGFFLFDHRHIIFVKSPDAPFFFECLPLFSHQIGPCDQLQTLTVRAAGRNRIRQCHSGIVNYFFINGAAHTPQADDGHTISFHFVSLFFV